MSVSSLKREEILKWHRSKAATPEIHGEAARRAIG